MTGRIVSEREYNRSIFNHNIIKVILKGCEKTFESKKDKEYIRMKAELIKQKKLNDKAWKKYNRYKILCFLTSDEKQKKLDHAEGILIRDRHGFDKNNFIGQQKKIPA